MTQSLRRCVCGAVVAIICLMTALPLHAQIQARWKSLRQQTQRTMQEACGTSRDGRRATTVGYFGSIYLSTDRGVTWRFVQVDEAQTLRSVAYFSDSGLVVAGGLGAVYRSDDHFRTWERVVVAEDDDITCVRHVGEQTLVSTGISGAVYRTSDAGRTWTKVQTSAAPLHAIAVAGNGRVMAVGGKGTVIASTDLGRTWTPTAAQAPDTITVLSVAWVGGSTWMIGGDTTYLARTTDNGSTWQTKLPSQDLVGERYNIRVVSFTSNGVGVAIVYNMVRPFGRFCISLDSGNSWNRGVRTLAFDTELMTMEDLAFFPASDTAVASGVFDRASIIRLVADSSGKKTGWRYRPRLSSGEESYEPVLYSATPHGTYIKVEDRDNLLVVSEHDHQGKELKTWAAKDSAAHWIGRDAVGNRETSWKYRRADILSKDRMIIYADSLITYEFHDSTEIKGYTFATADGGATWQTNPAPVANIVLNTAWQSASRGVAELWFRSYIAVTTDSARTWREAAYPGIYGGFVLLGVSRDSSSYLALGKRTGDGTRDLLRSADGITWDVLLSNVPPGRQVVKDGSLVSILGLQRNYAIVLPRDASSALLRDLGPSEGKDSDSAGFSCFVNDALITIRGQTDVHVSRDTGRTFSDRLTDPFLQYIAAVRVWGNSKVFGSGDYVYIANEIGDFYNGPIDSVITGVEEQTDVFSYPPYPNPFSVSTTIAVTWFWTVSPQTLTLKVYNQLGEEVRDLTAQLHARVRSYSSTAIFDAADLPNGLYFAVCQGPNGSATQTIMLVR